MSSASRAEGSLFSNSAITLHLEDLGYPEKSLKSMNRCQEVTGDKVLVYCNNCDFYEVHPIKHWCNLRTCPYCAKKRKRRIIRQYLPYLENLPINHENFLYFLTISPQNYENFNEGLIDIKKNFNKFLRLGYSFKKNKKGRRVIDERVSDRIKGSIYVIEGKQKKNSWNVHIHAIIYGKYLDNRIRGKCLDCGQNLMKKDYETGQFYCASRKCNSFNVIINQDSKLTTLWKKTTKDQDVNMHITRQSSASYTLNYMLKYISASKEDFQDEHGVAVYINAIHDKRLISTTGCFYGKKFEDLKPKCPWCGSKVYFKSSFDDDFNEFRTKRRREFLSNRGLLYKKKNPPPPPPPFTFSLNLDVFI